MVPMNDNNKQDDKFSKQIAEGLDKALSNQATIKALEPIHIGDPSTQRFVIFSDHHRGARNGADDFQRSERAYNAALAYYFAMGYKLIALGDVEELWEERHKKVFESYVHTLDLEKEFHKDGRYYRAFGNHDDDWSDETAVNKYLVPRLDNMPLKVYESFCIPVESDGVALGQVFLIHGHQGTSESDRWAWFSRLMVRNFWRPFQRLTKIRLTTPAKSWELRKDHNEAMYNWAQKQDKLILITGHTHYPVFESKTHEEQLVEEKVALQADSKLDAGQKQKMLAALAAKLEWVRTQQNRGADEEASKEVLPYYFNSGCCSFSDGDVTGLEIADDEIKLVRWPNNEGKASVETLATTALKDVFAKINSA